MTDHLTPELLAALDLESDMGPTLATKQWLETHQRPDLSTETAKFRREVAAGDEAKMQAAIKRTRWINQRKNTFKKASGQIFRERGLFVHYYQDGANPEELAKITGWPIEEVKKRIEDIFS